MFLKFANLYQYFIQGSSKIEISLMLMLKTIKLSKILALIVIKANNDNVIDSANSLKLNLSKSKYIKLSKARVLKQTS